MCFVTSAICFAEDERNIDLAEVSNVLTIEENKVGTPFEGMVNDEISPVSYKTSITINGSDTMLYPTFDDSSKTIKTIKEQCELVLEEMKNEYELEDFSSETWEAYYDILCDYEESVTGDNAVATDQSRYEQISKLDGFFDIYENEGENASILAEVEEINKAEGVKTKGSTETNSKIEKLEELSFIMPSNTGWEKSMEEVSAEIEEMSDSVELTAETKGHPGNGNFSVKKGVDYAKKYATNANKKGYGVISGGDCTNFVSQIKYAGGVPYHKIGNEKKVGITVSIIMQITRCMSIRGHPVIRANGHCCHMKRVRLFLRL